MHTKLRLEIFIEAPARRRAENVLIECGIKGWTVLPAIAGYNGRRRWNRGDDISGASDLFVIVAIGDPTIIEPALEKLHDILDNHIGVLNVSEVKVLRPKEF